MKKTVSGFIVFTTLTGLMLIGSSCNSAQTTPERLGLAPSTRLITTPNTPGESLTQPTTATSSPIITPLSGESTTPDNLAGTPTLLPDLPTTIVATEIPSGTPTKVSPTVSLLATQTPGTIAGSQGIILYVDGLQLWQLDVATQESQQLTFSTDTHATFPRWSPDGQFFIYKKDGKLWLRDRDGKFTNEIASDVSIDWWINKITVGYCQYSQADDYPCFRYNIESGKVDPLHTDKYWQFNYSPDLSKVFAQEYQVILEQKRPQPQVYLLDVTTNGKLFERETGIWTEEPQWTPDSREVAFTASLSKEYGSGGDVFVVDANGENSRQLTNFQYKHIFPAFLRWSPDSEWLALIIVTGRSNPSKRLAVLKSDGSILKDLGVRWSTDLQGPVWSLDGQKIAFLSNQINQEKTWELYTVDVNTKEISQLTHTSTHKYELDWK